MVILIAFKMGADPSLHMNTPSTTWISSTVTDFQGHSEDSIWIQLLSPAILWIVLHKGHLRDYGQFCITLNLGHCIYQNLSLKKSVLFMWFAEPCDPNPQKKIPLCPL
jgi:hypothetical protein